MPVADATAYYDGSGTGFVSAADGIAAATQMYADLDYWREMKVPVGNYYVPTYHTGGPSLRSTQYQAWVSPYWFPAAMTFSSVSMYINSASTAGQTHRIAFYTHNANGWSPDTLIADIGTVATDTTGLKTISSLSLSLPKGIVWGALIAQSTVATAGSCYGGGSLFNITSTNQVPIYAGSTNQCHTFASGAAPSAITTATLNSGGSLTPTFEFLRSA